MWRLYFILLLFLVAGTTFAQPIYILHKPIAEQSVYIDSLRQFLAFNFENTFKSSDTLEKLIAYAEKNDDRTLASQLEFSKVYIQSGLIDAETEQQILKDIKNALHDGDTLVAIDGYHVLSYRLYNSGNKTKAIEYALQGYELCKGIKTGPPIIKTKSLYRLAEWYYEFKEFEKTKNILLELKTAKNRDLYNILTPGELNTLALTYRELGLYDSSVFYFNEIYEDKQHKAPIVVRGIAAGNIGTILKRQGDYPNTLIWLKRELALWRSEKGEATSTSCFATYAGIADVYITMDQLAAAQVYLDSAERIRYIQGDVYALSGYYRVHSNISEKKGNYKQALLYKDSLLMAKDSLARKANLSKLLEAEKKVAESRHDVELARLDTLRQKSVWIRNFIILLVGFVAVVVIVLINRNLQKHKEKELRMENERNRAQAELLKFTKTLHDRNRELDELKEEVIKLADRQEVADTQEHLFQLQQSTILTDEEWDKFRNLFEQVYPGYINTVKEQYHEITPAELRYITLVKLDMNNKEIANVLGIGHNSVRNYKFRLRKKLGLTEEDNLEEMIRNIQDIQHT